MKLIFWNAYHGFLKSKRHMLEAPIREKAFSKVIQDSGADAAVILEMKGYTDARLLDYAGQWGHEHVLLTPGSFPFAISSNRLIRRPFYQSNGLVNGFIIASIGDLRVFITHIPPAEHTDRHMETREILPQLIHLLKEGEEFLMLADLNCGKDDVLSQALQSIGLIPLGDWSGVDHVLASPALHSKILSASQMDGPEISKISDHAPIIIEIEER